jgi:hypothetical protein
MHKVITYRLEKEICTIEALQDMHVVLIGMNIKPEIALKGGEAGEEALLQQ